MTDRFQRHAAHMLFNGQPWSVLAFRAAFEGLRHATPRHDGSTFLEVDVGVPALRIEPREGHPPRATLLLHGGGFVAGSVHTHARACAHLCAAARSTGLVIDYRRAPEHPYPAALDDAHRAWRWLVESGVPTDQLALAGDSAGGGLALSLVLRLRDAGEPLPAALWLASPWVDLGPRRRYHNAPAVDEALAMLGRMYAGTQPVRDPFVSPIYATVHDLPPTLLHYGAAELLAEDSERLAHQLRLSGVPLTVRRHAGSAHGLAFTSRWSAQGRVLLQEAGRFLGEVLEGQATAARRSSQRGPRRRP